VKLGAARAAAVDWVSRHAGREPWFRGAYFSGSTVGRPDTAELPGTSDIDVMVVIAQAEPPPKPGKFLHLGALLEVSYLAGQRLASAEEVLASYHLAGSFRLDTIIADPTGELSRLQAKVSRHFAEEAWVRRRCEQARQGVEGRLAAIDASAPWHDQVTAWLFGTGVTMHVVLVAALRNPTVRLRYLAGRDVLMEYGRTDLYAALLALLGCADLTAERAQEHLRGLAQTFDAAAAVARTPVAFSADITAAARPVAIDGSLELIRAGSPREAVFWIVATFARCHRILAADAPADLQHSLAPAFAAVLDDLGIASTDDLLRRAAAVLQCLPTLWEGAEAILAANPGISRP